MRCWVSIPARRTKPEEPLTGTHLKFHPVRHIVHNRDVVSPSLVLLAPGKLRFSKVLFIALMNTRSFRIDSNAVRARRAVVRQSGQRGLLHDPVSKDPDGIFGFDGVGVDEIVSVIVQTHVRILK